MKKSVFLALATIFVASCSHKSVQVSATAGGQISAPISEISMRSRNYIPSATVFKMSGDYANHVAVTLSADGRLQYYPAPSDISSGSIPMEIADGWYLNRQGLSANSVFTKWTFEEYKNLGHTPSQEEILKAIIPGARVTEFRKLPVTSAEAAQMSIDQLKQLL